MKTNQVAVQLYTVREHLQTIDGIAESLQKVREIGYQAVELHPLAFAPAELANVLADKGMTCCSAMASASDIINHPQKVVEMLDILNCSYGVFGYPEGVDFSSLATIESFAHQLDHAGHVLRENGKTLTYHNHSIEFQRIQGQLILDHIYNKTSPINLQAELDTYWVQHGGQCPVAWCDKMKNRLPLIHLKDYVIVPPAQPTFTEIGAGNLDFKRILAGAENSGCRWFIVEQDICPISPFESLKKSFDYIAEYLCA